MHFLRLDRFIGRFLQQISTENSILEISLILWSLYSNSSCIVAFSADSVVILNTVFLGFLKFGAIRVDQTRVPLFDIFLKFPRSFLCVILLCVFPVFQTVLLMSASADVTHPLIDAVVDVFFNYAHLDRVGLEGRQTVVEEGRFGSRLLRLTAMMTSCWHPESLPCFVIFLIIGFGCVLYGRVGTG